MHVELLYFDDCPSWATADQRLREVARTHGVEVHRRQVTTHDEAERTNFRWSPTILINGRDPFATGDEPHGLSCRIFQTPEGPAGSPTVAQLHEALGSAGRPGGHVAGDMT